jgi:uroporphyrin-III C-methyltransferase
MLTVPFEMPTFLPGWVWLVGAGPGDPGLLSLHALNGLSQADVVVYDALVDKRILEAARPEAELIYAGKRGGKPSPKQTDISQRLIALARANRRILRLKGGDPFVFGRGGEEALALVDAGIPFRLVPGITAGIGGLAYAGIPATHRDVNTAVTFVTGHQAGGSVPEHLDWAALAKGSPVLVIYMAVQNLPAIVEKLLAGGRDAAEPMAIISKASTPEQTVLETTLGACVEDCATAKPPPPAMVVIGRVVELRASLDWLGALPAPLGRGRKLAPDPFAKSPLRPA